jgi:hypothetical protein
VLGTCLTTGELRKLMARFIDVEGATDLDVHHEAVRLARCNGEVERALSKALDRRHDLELQRFNRTRDVAGLVALWEDAVQSGAIPGAYWAVLTHRRTTAELRQRVFGDVHMLSHLVGAANRADIRRLVALERENEELREQLEDRQSRLSALLNERERWIAERDELNGLLAASRAQREDDGHEAAALARARSQAAALSAALAVQVQRCEEADAASEVIRADASRLESERARLEEHALALGRELAAAEAQLREAHAQADPAFTGLHDVLGGRRLLYIGGRPNSNPAIRHLVLKHGGEYRHHDGGIEDRKGLLEPALAWADLVVFPVDCVDHDSVSVLKRGCMRHGTPFVPLRSASVASFAAALASMAPVLPDEDMPPNGMCLRHA